MKHNINIKYLFLLLAFAVLSCNEAALHDMGEGCVDVNVLHDESVEIVPLTRSGEGIQVMLEIFDAAGNRDFGPKDISLITAPITLETGKYTAVATAGEETTGGVAHVPFYRGEASFEVKPATVSSVDIVCSLTSVKVTAAISDDIKKNFEYSLEVTNGQDSYVFVDGADADDLVAYFKPTGKLSWTMTLTNADNEKFTLSDSYVSVKAQQYYALAFNLEAGAGDSVGAGEFKIVVDDSFNDPKTHDVTLVIDKSAATITGSHDIAKTVSDPCTGAEYLVASTLPFTSLAVTHADMALVAAGLPQVVELYGNPADIAVLRDAGVGVSFFGNGYSQTGMDAATTEVRLDFNAFADKLAVGTYQFTIAATNASGKEQTMDVAVAVLPSLNEPVYEPWAKFVYVKGTWNSSTVPAGLKVQYRLSNAQDWTDFTAQDPVQISIDEETKTYRMFVCGLADNAVYQFRVVSDTEALSETVVATEAAAVLDNMNFDGWKQASKSDANDYDLTKEVWYPNADFNNFIWDTANGGTATIGKYPTERETSDVVSGCAVKMTSLYVNAVVLKTFAAGNIYTGKFVEAVISLTDPGAKLDWGVPFNGRPLALRGYYKYAPQVINKNFNKSSGEFEHYVGQMDKCQIQVGLFEWDSPFRVDTQKGQMVNFGGENPTVVAYTKYESDESVPEYRKFVVPFEFRKRNTKPTYAIVTACSSYLGDYFVGGEGSQLYVDEFSFIYDPMEEDFASQRAAFFSMFN